MRITYLAHSIIPSRTANSIHVMKMCQAFAKNANEVTLIVPDRKYEMEPGVKDDYAFYGVNNTFAIKKPLPVRYSFQLIVFGFLAARLAKRKNPDLVYCRSFSGCFFASLMNLPVVFESHSPFMDGNTAFRKYFLNIFKRFFFKKLISNRNFLKLVVITHSLKSHYEKQFPVLKNKIVVAPDAADPVPKTKTPPPFFIDKKKLQVGYVGHLYQGRGVELIINLAARIQWADFHIIGGKDSDIQYWKNLTTSLANIHFHGFLPPSEVSAIQSGFDVLLAPYQLNVSVSGGVKINTAKWMSPLKVFEYMAAGKAILCSNLPSLREVLSHNHNALLCDPTALEDWEQALVALRDDIELRSRLGRQAKKDFLEKYTWDSRANLVLSGSPAVKKFDYVK